MPAEKMISFAEIVKGRDASVPVTDDAMVYAVDLVMAMNGINRNYAAQVFPFKKYNALMGNASCISGALLDKPHYIKDKYMLYMFINAS